MGRRTAEDTCEEDGQTRKRRGRNGDECVEEFNETPAPLKRTAGTREEEKRCVPGGGAGAGVCERIHLGNTKLCIIYQAAVGFVLVFTVRDRS